MRTFSNAMERIVEEVYQVSHKTGGTDLTIIL